MNQNFRQISIIHQTTDLRNSKNTDQNIAKKQKQILLQAYIFKLQKVKGKFKILKKPKVPYLRGRRMRIILTFPHTPCKYEDSGVKYLKC